MFVDAPGNKRSLCNGEQGPLCLFFKDKSAIANILPVRNLLQKYIAL
jgi:hypothetical protein